MLTFGGRGWIHQVGRAVVDLEAHHHYRLPPRAHLSMGKGMTMTVDTVEES